MELYIEEMAKILRNATRTDHQLYKDCASLIA
jgi:hypothetical protein